MAEKDAAGSDASNEGANDDLKAKMKAALEAKNTRQKGVAQDGPVREKAHGSEVVGGAPKMHRRKAGGGGS
jgi:Family of unknown function (DUF5302)